MFPFTRSINPSSSKRIAYHLVFSQLEPETVKDTINPTPQIKTVLETSTTDLQTIERIIYLAIEEIYLVTDTPAILKTAIVKIPKNTKKSNVPN